MDDSTLLDKVNSSGEHERQALDQFLLAEVEALQPWQREVFDQLLAAGHRERLIINVPRHNGFRRDDFGTWYYPPRDAEHDAVAATVASWDLATLGVVP